MSGVPTTLLDARLRWVALDSHARDGTDVAVLVCLVTHADRDAVAYPGQRTIARWARCHQKTAARRLERLTDAGDIAVIHHGTRLVSARYWLACDGLDGLPAALAAPLVDNGKVTHLGASPVTPLRASLNGSKVTHLGASRVTH